MSVFVLKIIAMITMVIDHIGYCFYPNILLLRLIGRIAFPIYAFLIAQGFLYTKNRNKYFLKVLLMAILSEIPFDMTFFNSYFYLQYQNVLITFSIVLFSLILYEHLKSKGKDAYYAIMVGFLICFISQADYSIIGPIVIYMYYFSCKNNENYKIKPLNVILIGTTLIIYEMLHAGLSNPNGLLDFVINRGYIYIGVVVATMLIIFYNTKLGPKNKIINTIFYLFYPAHIIALYLISLCIK